MWRSDDGCSGPRSQRRPWSPRDEPRVVVFNGALMLVGGQGGGDVWRSTDGESWTELSPRAEWGDRHDFGASVFGGELWVYGGRRSTPSDAMNDVWHSADGISWAPQTDSAPWSDRSGAHSIVFADRLWLFSGKHTGARDNWGGDIWTMRREQ